MPVSLSFLQSPHFVFDIITIQSTCSIVPDTVINFLPRPLWRSILVVWYQAEIIPDLGPRITGKNLPMTKNQNHWKNHPPQSGLNAKCKATVNDLLPLLPATTPRIPCRAFFGAPFLRATKFSTTQKDASSQLQQHTGYSRRNKIRTRIYLSQARESPVSQVM